MSRRSDQRRAAVFALYQHDLTGRPLDEVFERDAMPFTRALAHATADHLDELDPLVAKHARGWALERIAPLERAILRTALLEMRHPELTAPLWLQGLTRPILVGAAVAVSVAWWLRSGGRTAGHDDALVLLALVFALRCALDPWNLVYYHLPLALALVAWETRRGHDWPVLTLAVSVLCWLSFVTYDARAGMGPFVLYFAWMGPLLAYLAIELFGAPRRGRVLVRASVPSTG